MVLLWWGVFFLLFSFMLMVVVFSWLVMVSCDLIIVEWEFFDAFGLCLKVLVMIDVLSILFSSLVCLIGGCVFIFSVGYMRGDKFVGSFCWLTVFFVLSMNTLIFIPNLVFLLLGWDLLGVISFLLVIYYQNKSSVGAGMMTVLINRLGDVFLLFSVSLSSSFGGWDSVGVEYFSGGSFKWIVGVMLVMAAMTKSAQFPFSVWLPVAMAAPTPISALVHSSTLVVAGVYLLFRYYPIIGAISGLLYIVSKIGCYTLLMASLMACFESDIKKLIALSTLSHLGFMVYVLGLGYPVFSFFHLLSHALFKSLLFLCVGYYIYYSSSLQDVRQLCGVSRMSSSVLISCFVVGFSSLCGLPYLSGFYSKHAILESSISSFGGWFELLCLVVGAMVSCFYSTWVLLWVVFGSGGSNSGGFSCVDGISWFEVSTYLLAVYSVFFGYLGYTVLVEFCDNFVISPNCNVILFFVTSFGGVVSTIYWFMVSFGSGFYNKSSRSSNLFMLFLGSMWFLKYLYGYLPGEFFMGSSKVVSALEVGWVEMLSSGGVLASLGRLSVLMWILERASVLVIMRFSGVVGIVAFFFFDLIQP